MYRQGDVLLVPAGKIPAGKHRKVEAENGRVILARGEATGHHHSISAYHADLIEIEDKSNPLLIVREAVPLEHQEHGAIEIAPGAYWVLRQREYTPQEPRRVQD